MLESVRRQFSVPRLSSKVFVAVGTAASFGWLLMNDMIHPIVIYALEFYLTF
ncbi:MAG: hypothetical protein AAF481_15755 [Acidobacteriota bacterium]